MTYSFPKLVEILASGEGLVLATVVETEGSTPQVPGASAVFSAKGLEAGTVGGGVLEARTQAIAGVALRDGRCRLVRFRLDADPADKDGAICGGRASVLVDPLNRARAEVFGEAGTVSVPERPAPWSPSPLPSRATRSRSGANGSLKGQSRRAPLSPRQV
jgi:xanthine/CO dehydrogenase XdhC/CoxF family maturation factor